MGRASELLTVPQAAERLGVTRQRVLAWIAEGRLLARKVGRQWLLAASDCVRPVPRPPGNPLMGPDQPAHYRRKRKKKG